LHQQIAVDHCYGLALLHDGADIDRIERAPLDRQAAAEVCPIGFI
jgi:hypothetical protein